MTFDQRQKSRTWRKIKALKVMNMLPNSDQVTQNILILIMEISCPKMNNL